MENQNKQIQPYSAITPENILDWKARYGADNISEITLKTAENPVAKFIICKPSRSVMDSVAQHGVNKNVTSGNKTLIANCVLGGDMQLMEQDGGIYTALLRDINTQVNFYESEIKKL